MSTAIRNHDVAINWRITLLGLNLAVWLVAALVVAMIFLRPGAPGQSPIYPGFGYNLPLFNQLPVLYPTRIESEPVVGLKRIGGLPATGYDRQLEQANLDAHPDRGAVQRELGRPHRLAGPTTPAPAPEPFQH